MDKLEDLKKRVLSTSWIPVDEEHKKRVEKYDSRRLMVRDLEWLISEVERLRELELLIK